MKDGNRPGYLALRVAGPGLGNRLAPHRHLIGDLEIDLEIGFYESVGSVKALRFGDEVCCLTVSLTGTSFYPHSG